MCHHAKSFQSDGTRPSLVSLHGSRVRAMPTAFTVPTPHAAPHVFPAFHSRRSPSHTTAALKQAAEKAPAHCLAPAMAPAEISSCDYLSLEWPEALPRPHPGPRPGASSLPPSNCSCTSCPGLLSNTSCLTPAPWPFQIVAVFPEKGHH